MEANLFDELAGNTMKLCSDVEFADSELHVLCPLSPDVQDELFSPSSDSLLSSPLLEVTLHGLHEASSYIDALHQQPQQESAVSCHFDSQYRSSSCSEEDLSTCPSHLSDDASNRSQKRAKLEWTQELHYKFVEAVESLPAEKQVPSRILERMGHWGCGLTRANVASHLQKYRNRKRDPASLDIADAFPPAAATAVALSGECAGGVVMGVPCYLMHMGAAFPQAPTLPASWHPTGATAPANAAAASGLAAPGVRPAPVMIPTPVVGHCASAAGGSGGGYGSGWPCLDPPELPVPEELTRALQDVLAGKRKRGPIGLRLDCAAVMQHWNSGRTGAGN